MQTNFVFGFRWEVTVKMEKLGISLVTGEEYYKTTAPDGLLNLFVENLSSFINYLNYEQKYSK